MMRLSIGYPGMEDEIRIARNALEGISEKDPEPVLGQGDVLMLRDMVKKVSISEEVLEYIRNIVQITRNSSDFSMGATQDAEDLR